MLLVTLAMRNTTLVLLALVVALSGACASKGRGGIAVDANPVADAAISCVYEDTTYTPGELFFVGSDGCSRRCSCMAAGEVDCLAMVCQADSGSARPDQLDSHPDDDDCSDADQACLWSGGVLAVGQSGVDGCSTYFCQAGGNLTCTAGACADAGVSVACSLPTQVDFGLSGGFWVDDTSNILDARGTLTANRLARPCVWQLPACGTPCAITVATIAKDLADPDVQSAFASVPGTLFGARRGAGDVANFRITLGDGRSILIGFPCCRDSDQPCQPIPKGVQRLANDLEAILAAIPSCQQP
jgi:hypothetical protein